MVRSWTLEAPANVVKDIPFKGNVIAHRKAIQNILHGHDNRLLLIAGPCSIFNKKGTLEFAERFKKLRENILDKIELVLRAPPAKPRTISKAGQWEGLVHEPAKVGEYDPITGIRLSREILRDIAALDIPIAIEILDTKRTRYFEDLLSLSWTGCRSVESSDLRRHASGSPWPVGFKNRTDGAIKPALDAIDSARGKNFLDSINPESGEITVELSEGNPNTFLILRGGEKSPNYDKKNIDDAQTMLLERKLPDFVVVDCAHGNSVDEHGKRTHTRQTAVFKSTFEQWKSGNKKIGAMMEVYLKEGKQEVLPGVSLSSLAYDISPTDACLGWDEFELLIQSAISDK